MPKNLNAKRIENLEEYKKIFLTDDNRLLSEEQQNELLKTAMDVRKFEIEMYWKRTAFFWAFLVSIYTAYFVLLEKQQNNQYALPLMLVSMIAVVFSIAWFLANKGSKFWQENWVLSAHRK